MRRTLVVGAGLATLYVAVTAVTMALTTRPVRPLFDGLTTPPPYRWVEPPPGYGMNVEPEETEVMVELTTGGSAAAGPASSDGQVVLNLPAQAIPPRRGDRAVRVTISPRDAARLGTFPSGLTFDGNAYEIGLAYHPSGRAVTSLAQPGNIVVATPEPASVLLFSADGREWETLDTQRVGGPDSVGSPFPGSGWYVAAIPGTAPPAPEPSGALETARRVLIAVLALALAAVLALRVREARRTRASM